LKQVYLATHPGAGLQRSAAAEPMAVLEAEVEEDDV
jgi:hypothetical protein